MTRILLEDGSGIWTWGNGWGVSWDVAFSAGIELQLSGSSGAWTAVTTDVLSNLGIVANYGIQGNGPNDRVAATGTMSFALNNSYTNSGGKAGYYTPGHANALAGFELGIGARLVLTTSGSTFYKFTGRLDSIAPVPGIYMSRAVLCTAVDWMDEAARHPLKRIATQFAQRADQLIATVIGNMTYSPAASTLAVAQQEYPYALDTGFDESTTALTELQRIADSDRGVIVIRGDQTQGGTFQFYDRRQRMNGPQTGVLSASTILETSMTGFHMPRQRQKVYNRASSTAHPRIVDPAATTVLYRLTSAPTIPNGTTAIFEGNYTDPSMRAQRVAAASMVVPVATTDYTFGTSASDSSLTGNLAVAASFGSNTARFAVTNNGGVAGVLNFFQARGAGIYDYSPVVNQASAVGSINSYGQSRLSVDMPYEYSNTAASAIGDYELSTWSVPRYSVDSVSFVGSGTACLLDAGLRREPGDLIGLTEYLSGFSASEFFIQAVQMKVDKNQFAEFTWLLQKRVEFTDFWVLNIDKLSELSSDNTSVWSVLGL